MSRLESNEPFMRRAIELARRGLGTTHPNPIVGAVIVRDGKVVGEGYHARAGEPHAEVVALQQAGEAARGATMFVTLEPCNHHGRTPPCTEAILRAGIERVYFASRDTNPHVEGGGSQFLRTHGVDCIEGPLAEEANYLNRGFLHWTRTGRPWVVAKFAASLDGRIATRTGESQWITGSESRQRGHELRREVDAILVGSGTVLADDPLLTVRGPMSEVRPETEFVRIVLDGRGTSPIESKVFDATEGASTIVATTQVSPEAWRDDLREHGVDVSMMPADKLGRVDLATLLEELGRREIRSLLVEGGPTVHGSFFDAGLVNEVFAFIAPMVIGGADAPGAVGGQGVGALQSALRLESVQVETCGSDVLVRGIVNQQEMARPLTTAHATDFHV